MDVIIMITRIKKVNYIYVCTLIKLFLCFRNLSAWQQFHNGISRDKLYKKADASMIKKVLHDLTHQPIIKAGESL